MNLNDSCYSAQDKVFDPGLQPLIPKTKREGLELGTQIIKAEVRQINKEVDVTNFLAEYIEHLNGDVLTHQVFKLGLQMDESDTAKDNVNIDSRERKFLRKYADPMAVDFVNSALRILRISNRRILRNFKLRLIVEGTKGANIRNVIIFRKFPRV